MSRLTALVTGGNDGIGLALVKKLLSDNNCSVFLGSRSVERGEKAVAECEKECGIIRESGENGPTVSLVQIDVTDVASVRKAADLVKGKLGGAPLTYLVNNAGAGLNTGMSDADIIRTNLYGPKLVTEAFWDLLDTTGGDKSRICMVGSGGGPGYVSKAESTSTQRMLCSRDSTWSDVEALIAQEGFLEAGGEAPVGMRSYSCSKACLAVYTVILARENPNIISTICSPGFINTKMTEGYGAKLTPAQGTVAILNCIFGATVENGGNIRSGWYYGSDAKRSPLHYMREPGTEEYDGTQPDFMA